MLPSFAMLLFSAGLQCLQLKHLSAHRLTRSHRFQTCHMRADRFLWSSDDCEKTHRLFLLWMIKLPAGCPNLSDCASSRCDILWTSLYSVCWNTPSASRVWWVMQPDDWQLIQSVLRALSLLAGDSGRFWHSLTQYRRWICFWEMTLNGETRVEGVEVRVFAISIKMTVSDVLRAYNYFGSTKNRRWPKSASSRVKCMKIPPCFMWTRKHFTSNNVEILQRSNISLYFLYLTPPLLTPAHPLPLLLPLLLLPWLAVEKRSI